MSSRACQVLASLHLRQREPSLGRHEVTFSAFASQNSSKHGKTKGTRHSPDMLTLRLSKNIAEQVTSGPMVGHHVTPWWPDVRGRVAMSSPVDKVGIEIGQLEDGGSNGDDIMSIFAIDS